MKKITVMIAALFALSAPAATFSASDGGHGGGSHGKGHSDHQGSVAHDEVVDGVKVTFKIMSMKEHMQAMGMELPKGMKETHHLSIEFKDVKSGKALVGGEVKLKVQNPDKTDQTMDLMAMQGHFGTDLDLSKRGKYGMMSKFQLKDGKVRNAKFWYSVK